MRKKTQLTSLLDQSNKTCPEHYKGGRLKGYPPFLTLNTFRRKLYMKYMMAAQAMTAICCVVGSTIRGTFKPKEMAENARRPSAFRVSTKAMRA